MTLTQLLTHANGQAGGVVECTYHGHPMCVDIRYLGGTHGVETLVLVITGRGVAWQIVPHARFAYASPADLARTVSDCLDALCT